MKKQATPPTPISTPPNVGQTKTIGYARCSTTKQKQDIERQISDLKTRGAETIYHEYASGADQKRTQLTEALKTLKQGDTLTATEVSRLTRQLSHLLQIIDEASTKKIKLTFGPIEFDFTEKISPMHLAMLQMMGIFAELERNLDIERIDSGLKHAKEKGIKLGRPKKTITDIPAPVKNHYPDYQAGELTKKTYAKKCNISRPTLNKYLALLETKEL